MVRADDTSAPADNPSPFVRGVSFMRLALRGLVTFAAVADREATVDAVDVAVSYLDAMTDALRFVHVGNHSAATREAARAVGCLRRMGADGCVESLVEELVHFTTGLSPYEPSKFLVGFDAGRLGIALEAMRWAQFCLQRDPGLDPSPSPQAVEVFRGINEACGLFGEMRVVPLRAEVNTAAVLFDPSRTHSTTLEEAAAKADDALARLRTAVERLQGDAPPAGDPDDDGLPSIVTGRPDLDDPDGAA